MTIKEQMQELETVRNDANDNIAKLRQDFDKRKKVLEEEIASIIEEKLNEFRCKERLLISDLDVYLSARKKCDSEYDSSNKRMVHQNFRFEVEFTLNDRLPHSTWE